MAEALCSWLTVYATQILYNKEQYVQMKTRIMVLYLLQVLGCSVLMDLRNKATHSFALFTTVSELNIRFFATNK